jgi:TatD DNase family protein
MKYFDAHCHVQFPEYEVDRVALLTSMEEAEVGGIVVGVDHDSSHRALDLVQDSSTLFAAAGLHPNYTQTKEFEMDAFRELLRDPKMVAVGECGLDYFRPEDVAGAVGLQKEVFLKHVELATEFQKPLMIHSRPSKGSQNAYRDLVDILKSAKREYGDALTGNVHFFVGGIDEARALLELDFTMSYTAVLTFTHDYDDVVQFAPLSHLITETDSPYAAPAPNRGKRNDPRAVASVVEAISRIKGEDLEKVRVDILQNVHRVFKIPSVSL